MCLLANEQFTRWELRMSYIYIYIPFAYLLSLDHHAYGVSKQVFELQANGGSSGMATNAQGEV